MTEQPVMTMPPPVVTAPVPKTGPAYAKSPKGLPPAVWGVGRRKTAVARVRVRPGAGVFLVNDREVDVFFCNEKDRHAVRTPLRVTETSKTVDVFVNVNGGGISGQAGAVVLGLARALMDVNPTHEPKLREYNLLTRDAREVERKKYGRSGARRRFQFSKR